MTPGPPIAATRGEFLRTFENLLVGPDPRQGIFRGRRFLHPGFDLALDLPKGWETQNTAEAVAASPPERDALVMLELQGPPGDPRQAAAKFAQANGITLERGESVSVGGWDGYHALALANSRSGPLVLDLTWIAHPQGVLRLLGLAPQSRYSGRAAAFTAVARSVERLGAEERASVRERRLRVVEARAGETLAALSARTHNVWKPQETAIANALANDVVLADRQLVKIAVEVPFRP